MYKVYLSGPITGLTFDEGDDWRKRADACMNHNIMTLNPLRCKEWARGKGVIKDDTKDWHPWMGSDAFIGTRDHWDTTRSDVVLVNLLGAKVVSIGTILEIGMAHEAKVPVILVMEDEGNAHDHGMVRSYATMRFNDLDMAIDCINALLSV